MVVERVWEIGDQAVTLRATSVPTKGEAGAWTVHQSLDGPLVGLVAGSAVDSIVERWCGPSWGTKPPLRPYDWWEKHAHHL